MTNKVEIKIFMYRENHMVVDHLLLSGSRLHILRYLEILVDEHKTDITYRSFWRQP